MKRVITARHLVMPKDLNPANRLFGGQMMAWIDEAAAMYAICQSKSHNIVTAQVSEVNFVQPVQQGDFLEFEAEMIKLGIKSFTVCITVYKKDYSTSGDYRIKVCECSLVFVTIDPATGKSIPHTMEWN